MNYVLDTNAISAMMRGDVGFLRRLRKVPSGDVGMPQPAVAEIVYGVARLPESKRKNELRARFDLVRTQIKTLTWSDAVSDAFGVIKTALEKTGQSIEDFDVAIGAHALVYNAVLVTNNTKHLRRIDGLVCEDWLT